MRTHAIHGGDRRFAKLDQAASTAEGTRVTQVCQVHPFISEHEAQVALEVGAALCRLLGVGRLPLPARRQGGSMAPLSEPY